MKRIIKYLKRLFFIAILGFGFIILSNNIVKHSAEYKTFNTVSQVQKHKVGLVLGAVKTLPNGRLNLYYKYRVEAAVALYKANKIDYILVSGDNGRKSYDEPSTFKEDLIKHGVPESKIYLDYAGFRTLDSVVRAKEVFGLNAFIVISQEFHNQRAIYLAKHHGIKAIGFNAKDVTGRYGLKTRLREYIAKTKAVTDIIFNVNPKFLGKKIEII
ncbi:SanA/YdcF family protein [Pontimicrobium sp. MEBiC01747]